MIKLKFWGVRGSIPTPSPTTARYGGNTSCVELRIEDHLFILDGGSGIRALGNELMKTGGSVKASVFITHPHWDHIQGIPFFTPAYIPGNEIFIYGAEEADKDLETIISEQMDATHFPVEMEEMAAHIHFHPLQEGTFQLDSLQVQTIYVNHPGNALGYRFHTPAGDVVYISDNEPFANAQSNADEIYLGEDENQKLVHFVSEARILIHDAQYTPDEYQAHQTWGHSPYTYPVRLALKAEVERLILFHHDPLHNDDQVDRIQEEARKLAKESNSHLKVEAAFEGMEIIL